MALPQVVADVAGWQRGQALEVQANVDRSMAVRMLTYTGLLYQRLIDEGVLREHGALPPVLPIVIYNGRRSWTAPTDVTDLLGVTDETLARYQPSQRYFLLDEGSTRAADLPGGNLVSALVALETTSATAVTALLAIIAALLGFALWFLQREIGNDEAHRELKKEMGDTRRELKADIKAVEADIKAVEADVKQLLAGQSRIEGLLEGLVVRGKLGRVEPIVQYYRVCNARWSAQALESLGTAPVSPLRSLPRGRGPSGPPPSRTR